MTADLARARPVSIRRPEEGAAPIDSFQILDHIAGGLVAPRQQQPTLATISAGFLQQGQNGGYSKPVVSRDGTIYVNGRQNLQAAFETVPGLAKALQATGRKRLTIAFPFDDPSLFIQQRFSRYSATALELYGDQHGITRIKTVTEEFIDQRSGEIRTRQKPIHEELPAGSDEYAQALEFVKTQTSVYFLLAEWKDGVARVVMPDGAGLYRLRMTSRNSINSIVNSLRWIAKLTGGRIAGVPFDLFLENHDVVSPDGKRRDVPVWQLVMRPPEQLALTTANFQAVMGNALEQGERLKVLPPPRETVEYAELEAPDIDLDMADSRERQEQQAPASRMGPTQREVDFIKQGGQCDPARQRLNFFGSFNHTTLRDKAVRSQVIREFTNGRVDSLHDYFADASENEARALFSYCSAWWEREKARRDAPPEPEPEPVPAVTAAWDGEDDNHDLIEPEDDVPLGDEPDSEPEEDLDLLTLYRQRLQAIESAKDMKALGLAGHDVARDENILTATQTELLRAAYKQRRDELSAS